MEASKCRVTKAHTAKDSTELTLEIGDIITVLRKGKYIWYGKRDDVKGFFPTENVEAIEELHSKDKLENPVSANAVIDKEKSQDSLQLADSKMSNEVFKEIEPTSPLEDKRRSRAKSAGRPPSQVFIKENILQRSPSTTDTLDFNSDDDQELEAEKQDPVSTKISSISQLVLELKQKPHMKTVLQKDTVTTTTTTAENSAEAPAWMKALSKKRGSISSPTKKPEPSDNTPPWMKEVIQRKHKLSLRGDEMLTGEEGRVAQDNTVKQSIVEVQSFQTRTSNQAFTEEKVTVQSTSSSFDSCKLNSNKSVTVNSSKAMQSYSLINENSNATLSIAAEVNTETMPEEMQAKELIPSVKAVDSKSAEVGRTRINSASVDSPDDIEKVDDNATKKTSTSINITIIKDAPEKRILSETPTVARFERQFSETKAKKEDIVKSSVAEAPVENNELKDIAAVKLVLEKLEHFETKTKANFTEIEKDIRNLQLTFDQQYQEITAIIQDMKSELSISIKSESQKKA